MSDLVTKVKDETVTKRAVSKPALSRINDEKRILQTLESSAHVPKVINFTEDGIVLKRIHGQSALDLLGDTYEHDPYFWSEAKIFLSKYVNAEMNLLKAGVLYRDLNLQHLIFRPDLAVLIDLEAAIIRSEDGLFHQNDMRGTWETMAPEEFPVLAQLSERTATYRVAVIAHLFLTGRLPFRRFPDSRARTYTWRKSHPPVISRDLPKPVVKVFSASLSRGQERRHKNPASFLLALSLAYEESRLTR